MPEGRFSRAYPQKWGQLLVLFGVCFVLFFVNLGQWDLWNPDEPRYAQVSREMVSSGDWILMHLNGQVYGEKPPLFFWAIGLSSFLMNGFNSFSARFPSALFGTLTVLLTFFLGKKLYCSRTGFLSGLVLATNVEFAYLATRANIDATLTFFTTASLLCFIHWYGDRKRLSIYGFYRCHGFCDLDKRAGRFPPTPAGRSGLSRHSEGLAEHPEDEALFRAPSALSHCSLLVSPCRIEGWPGIP